MSGQECVQHLLPETAKEILNKTLEEMQVPENSQKINEARNNVGNEMLKMMQFVFPIVMQIQMEVIKEYGFCEGREGIIKFSQIIRNLEREDPEIHRLHSIIKNYYLPPVSVHASESPAEERTSSS